jgi:hypothetical protein
VREVDKSAVYFVFCIDLLFIMFLAAGIMLCNLYVVFVAGAGAQDIITKVVILDFILLQQQNMKRDLFAGLAGREVLRSIKAAFEVGADISTVTAFFRALNIPGSVSKSTNSEGGKKGKGSSSTDSKEKQGCLFKYCCKSLCGCCCWYPILH